MLNPDDGLSSSQILIAGAGPTGLMLAVWLRRLGAAVRVVDPKAGPTQESRAIAVQARTLEFYDQLGLGDEAQRRGRNFAELSVWTRGRVRAAVNLKGLGAELTPHPNLYILTQDQNEALLLAELEARGGAVEWGTALSGFTQDGGGVTVTLRRGEQEQQVRAAYLAGCDGAGSAVRRQMEVKLSGGTYPQRFYVADVTARGELRENDVNVALGDDQFLVVFPMPGRHRHRLVGQLPPDAPEAVTFEAVRSQVAAERILEVEQVHWFSTYRVHHRVAERFQVGRVFLLGDAAHVHSPVGGQGMNTGLGDAVNLGWKLAQALKAPAAELLASYPPERRPFALSLVNSTDRAFGGVVNPAPLARWLRLQIFPRLLGGLSRPSAVRRLAFLTLSQLRIHYPQSALSRGQAGRVQGGDRLPWVRTPGGSNFAALRSLAWQVHVYGSPSPEILSWCTEREVALHTFAMCAQARRAGLLEGAFYLVRPDGYVGLAAPHFSKAEADAYARRWLPH